jgi:hypothetical protein
MYLQGVASNYEKLVFIYACVNHLIALCLVGVIRQSRVVNSISASRRTLRRNSNIIIGKKHLAPSSAAAHYLHRSCIGQSWSAGADADATLRLSLSFPSRC